MGVYTRKIHGDEYIYILAGKKQFFLGRIDNLEELDLQNLRMAARIIDKNFDKAVDKYFQDLQDIVQYVPTREKRKYVTTRKSEILNKLHDYEFKY